jgi:23S rRNA (guanine745-N1)-methyltransferase
MSHRAAAACISLLTCPVCAEPLAGEGRALRCPRRHSYDIAREGHVDLLPAGHGRTALTGDTADMLRARRRFLERGYFAPLTQVLRACRDALRQEPGAAGAAEHPRGLVVLEVGCGDGHFIGGLVAPPPGPGGARRAAAADPHVEREVPDCFFGLDISRDALRLAARRHPAVFFFRNDVHHRICLRDGCVDLLLDIFAPRNPQEFRRVLRPSGMLVVVIPREAHLGELRAALPLIGMQPEKLERTIARLAGAFELEAKEALEWRVVLDGEDVVDLVRMTPSARHLGEEAYARAAALGPLEVTFALDLLRLRPALPAAGRAGA